MDVKPRIADQTDLEVSAASAADSVRCWCGTVDFSPLGTDYVCCLRCGTVIYRQPVDSGEYTTGDDTGFYGDRYWRRHVPRVLGLPGLEERARTDLPERAVFHLVKILDCLPPGSRLLELGCGAGSLTYLLAQAGFDAEGLELGPAAIEVARERFGIEVHHGPLETLEGSRPYDAIVAIDVLEHLPDPLATMTLCAGRLADAGLLFLQTPCYRDEGPEWKMLLPREHLHLFNEASVEGLLRAAGFGATRVGGSLFPHDMWVTAALDGPLVERPEPLAGVPPVAVALIDAYAESVRAGEERNAIAADRGLKEQINESLQSELESVRADQVAKDKLLNRQDQELSQVRDDQRAKGELIARLDADLETVRHDQTAKADLIERLSSELASARDDQGAKEQLIERTGIELEAVQQDQSAKAALIDHLTSELETVRADQQAKELVIRQLDTEIQEARVGLEEARAQLEEIHSDRLYRALRAVRTRLGGSD